MSQVINPFPVLDMSDALDDAIEESLAIGRERLGGLPECHTTDALEDLPDLVTALHGTNPLTRKDRNRLIQVLTCLEYAAVMGTHYSNAQALGLAHYARVLMDRHGADGMTAEECQGMAAALVLAVGNWELQEAISADVFGPDSSFPA